MTDHALAVVDAGGPRGFEELTLAAVAARAGVATPSLYKHVDGLTGLRREVALVATRELTATMAQARASGPPEAALSRVAHALRDLARRRPGRYAAAQAAPTVVRTGDDEGLAAAGAAVAVVTDALRDAGLPAAALAGRGLVDAVRTVRSALHGFVVLETGGGFGMPEDPDVSFEHLLATLHRGLGLAGPPAA